MDPIYAQMLRDAGIEIDEAEVAMQPQVDEVFVPKEPEFEPIMGFQHMTHITQPRKRVPYRRISHFEHVLDQVTGQVPDSVEYKECLRRLKRSHLNVHTPMAYFRARAILKRTDYTSPHYRCIFRALREMGGYAISLSHIERQNIINDFIHYDSIWKERRPAGRKNFISYHVMMRLLFTKHNVDMPYILPGVRDGRKFDTLMNYYRSLFEE